MSSAAVRDRLRHARRPARRRIAPPQRPSSTPIELPPIARRSCAATGTRRRTGPSSSATSGSRSTTPRRAAARRARSTRRPRRSRTCSAPTRRRTAARLAFFDIETTGLAGGTGTYVVLAGLGSYEDGALPHAPVLPRRHRRTSVRCSPMLADDLARFDGLVTYNGRAFDVPFVETRMTLARLRVAVRRPRALRPAAPRAAPVPAPHARLPAGRRRAPPPPHRAAGRRPGLADPVAVLRLRARRAGVAPLRAVFRHNAEDVLSLVGVLARARRACSSATTLDPEDAVAVARWWEQRGRRGAGGPAVSRGAARGSRAATTGRGPRARHARLCKRAGERERAVALWDVLWAQGDRGAGLELAKHFEHRARDPRRRGGHAGTPDTCARGGSGLRWSTVFRACRGSSLASPSWLCRATPSARRRSPAGR